MISSGSMLLLPGICFPTRAVRHFIQHYVKGWMILYKDEKHRKITADVGKNEVECKFCQVKLTYHLRAKHPAEGGGPSTDQQSMAILVIKESFYSLMKID